VDCKIRCVEAAHLREIFNYAYGRRIIIGRSACGARIGAVYDRVPRANTCCVRNRCIEQNHSAELNYSKQQRNKQNDAKRELDQALPSIA
jgi:hypothetical protein